MSGNAVPVRRSRRKGPAQVGNVVPLHAPQETTEDIVRDVQGRRNREKRQLSTMLQDLRHNLDARHREHAQQCSELGYRMDRPTLDSWIEIGRRMLAAKGSRFR